MRHGSLFSGIGGFDLAATWMNWETVFHCEKDPFCRTVLKYYWPKSESYEDIYEFDATQFRGTIDVLSGGFPCQPFSVAGRRKGKGDDRYLWPQALRIIEQIRPGWIVLENVAGLFSILEPASVSKMEIKTVELFYQDSLQEPNSTFLSIQRRVIGTIISEIRSAGYILPKLADGTAVILCIPACSVGAPHRRDRIWFVAYPAEYSEWNRVGVSKNPKEKGSKKRIDIGSNTECWPATNSASQGVQGRKETGNIEKGGENRNKYPFGFHHGHDWNHWPDQSPVCGRDDGFPLELDGISISKWRKKVSKPMETL